MNGHERDDWGCDPSVRATRRLFARMESRQKELLKQLKIPPYDTRLRLCREDARDLFERMLSLPAVRGRGRDEEDAAALYIHCLIRALKQHGLPVPAGSAPEDTTVEELFREALT